MSWKDKATVLNYIPGVERPTQHIPFRRKIMWTAIVLVVYFYLTNVLVFGVAEGGGSDFFGQFRSILAGAQGSVLTLGIGPIVTASIVLQLLGGTGLLGLDTDDPRDQTIYQGLQKLLVVIVSVMTAIPFAFSGFLPASPVLAARFGLPPVVIEFLIFLQITFGAIVILYLDEVVSKWGIGSGVGLFIIAGVSQGIVGGLIQQFLPHWWGILTGQIAVDPLSTSGIETLFLADGGILPILTTILIFFIVVAAESTQIEIPLSRQNVSTARANFPIKLIYASVLPMILVRALQANIQMMGRLLNRVWEGMPTWLGNYQTDPQSGQSVVTDGLFYILAPIQTPNDWMWFTGAATQEPYLVMIRVLTDLSIMVFGGALFAVFWVRTTGMDAEAVAEDIGKSNMHVPGFRGNKGIMEKLLNRYIPYVTIMGGALVGLLAVGANMLGTIGGVTGTGLLLLVSITYKLYEQMAEEKMKDDPLYRKFFG